MEGGRGLPDKGEWELFVEDASGPLGLMIILPMLSDPLVPGRWVDLNGEQVQQAEAPREASV